MEVYKTGVLPESTNSFRRCCEAVRGAVPVEDVARQYTELTPLGSTAKAWFTGRCPLPEHEDQTPSFYIYPAGASPGGRWWCYGCNRGGDVIDLEFLCGDYRELWAAMVSLAVEHGVKLPERPQSWHRKQKRQRPVRDALDEVKVRYVQRRLFRIFAPAIERIEDETERQAEKAATWNDLRSAAVLIVARSL